METINRLNIEYWANRYDEAKEDIEQLNVLCAELKVVVKEIEDELELASEHKINKQYRYYDRLANTHYHLKRIYYQAYDTRIRKKRKSSGYSWKALCGGGIYIDADYRKLDGKSGHYKIHGISL